MEHRDWNDVYEDGLDVHKLINVGDINMGDPRLDSHEGAALNNQEDYFLDQVSNVYDTGLNVKAKGSGPTNGPKNGGLGSKFGENHFELHGFTSHGVMSSIFNSRGDEEQDSSAFPPSLDCHWENSPQINYRGLEGVQKNLAEAKVFASPVLPSQNEKSYNYEHYFHKQQKHQTGGDNYMSHLIQGSRIKTDAAFTPLVSPSITPRSTQFNAYKYQSNAPVQTVFEPLTSPALSGQKADKRRLSTSTYETAQEQPSLSKKRTPHSTPTMRANNSQRPKGRENAFVSSQASISKLPEPSLDGNKNISDVSGAPLDEERKNSDMFDRNNKPDAPFTVMGFTMKMLADQQKLPQERIGDESEQQEQLENADAKNEDENFKEVSSGGGNDIAYQHSSNEDTPVLYPRRVSLVENISLPRNTDKFPKKKSSHKLAEQGRRNRMNSAVKELSSLIPETYHDEISIPSKATTVELASRYIIDLRHELDELKKN